VASLLFFHNIVPHQDIAMSAAVVSSLRFPWLLPVWSIKVRSERAWQLGILRAEAKTDFKIRIADGVYFQNSDAYTAMSLIENIAGAYKNSARKLLVSLGQGCSDLAERKDIEIKFHLLVFTHRGSDTSTGQGLSDYIAPVRTLLNTRVQRGLAAVRYALRRARSG
jgi:hypothetical protein